MNGTASARYRIVFLPVAATTLVAATIYASALSSDGFDPAEPVLTVIFVVLFAWICFWFWIATIGTVRVWQARHELGADPDEAARLHESLPLTVVVIPIHNEEVDSVFARVEAMLESASGEPSGRFEFFVLSDTTDPDLWLREEVSWAELRRKPRRVPPLYYRHRPNKFRKKSGNIGEFLERWGSRYRYMIVLDADSVMEASTMTELVRRMEHVANLGILQAPSLPAMRRSLYARLQQFAASVYATPLFAGLSYCFQDHGTFWGHNAIIRVSAFMEHCGLPGLPGRPPFGGPILSHDFVEAALMQRAGFGVRLAWDLLGSYEQCPVSLAEGKVRDRRWCQGNLQHLRLMFTPTFTWQSRAHFATGILFYATSALWGLFVSLQLLLASRTPALSFVAFVPRTLAYASMSLLVTTLVFLFAVKFMGVGLLLADRDRAKAHGGGRKIVESALVEILLSVLVAPVLMVSQLASLSSALFGGSVDWRAANRDETASPWRDAVRAHGWQSALGFAAAVGTYFVSPTSFVWLSPLWLGLLAAVPLAALFASRDAGTELARRGLLLTPAETGAVPVLSRVRELLGTAPSSAPDLAFRFGEVVQNPWLNTLHVALLHETGAPSRPRKVLEPLVKKTLAQGTGALSSREAVVVLSDPWAMRTLHERTAGLDHKPHPARCSARSA